MLVCENWRHSANACIRVCCRLIEGRRLVGFVCMFVYGSVRVHGSGERIQNQVLHVWYHVDVSAGRGVSMLCLTCVY